MGLPPETIQIGRCYLTEEGRVRRVVGFKPAGWVRYRYRSATSHKRSAWRSGRLSSRCTAGLHAAGRKAGVMAYREPLGHKGALVADLLGSLYRGIEDEP